MGSPNPQKVVVAMSGGVDSSVAAALLKDEGYEVVGCFMRLGSKDSLATDGDPPNAPVGARPTGTHQGCCSTDDACDARMVAAMLDVSFYVLNFKPDFHRIIDDFVDQYNAGCTPNPCIRCNNWLKFGKLVAYARSIDARYVATGHYARVEHGNGRSRLLRAVDQRKDQSYVLFGTARDTLRRMLLPIGRYHKAQIRQIAQEKRLPVFDKPDSQEICFVIDNNYLRLVKERTPQQVRPGRIVDLEGRLLGQHGGHQGFTVGQRRGLNVSVGHPIYVIEKDAANNTITVGNSSHLEANGLLARQTNWLRSPGVNRTFKCHVKIRSNGAVQPAVARATGAETLQVLFDRPQRAVAPGQAVACYDGEELIGGGWIMRALRSDDGASTVPQ